MNEEPWGEGHDSSCSHNALGCIRRLKCFVKRHGLTRIPHKPGQAPRQTLSSVKNTLLKRAAAVTPSMTFKCRSACKSRLIETAPEHPKIRFTVSAGSFCAASENLASATAGLLVRVRTGTSAASTCRTVADWPCAFILALITGTAASTVVMTAVGPANRDAMT